MFLAIFVTLSLVSIIAGLLYIFLIWNFDYWKKRGIKGPKPLPFLGSFPSMITQKRNFTYDIHDIYKQYRDDEDFIGVFSVRTPQLMILNPEVAHNIYVTDFKNFRDNEASTWVDQKNDKFLGQNPFVLKGEEWKERRKEIAPSLTANRTKAVYPLTQEVCSSLVKYVRENCLDVGKDGVDGKDLSIRYTCEVVSDCILGLKAECFTPTPSPILEMTKSIFEKTDFFTVYPFLVGLWPAIRSFYKAKFCGREPEEFFANVLGNAFDQRRKQSIDRADFMNYILQLQEKKKLPNEILACHTMTFLLDGFETSASVIVHCLYQLAKAPSAQEKLYQEIMDSLNDDGDIEFETLHDMVYLEQCINESVRIFPPQLQATKLCTEECELTNKNGTKLQLKPNDIVLVPVYSLHHDEQTFPNPSEFIPERFSPDDGAKKFREMGAYLPFGDGPRICFGMKFSLTQIKASIVAIVRNFEMTLHPRTRKDNYLDPTYFLGALAGGVWLEFKERE